MFQVRLSGSEPSEHVDFSWASLVTIETRTSDGNTTPGSQKVLRGNQQGPNASDLQKPIHNQWDELSQN